VKNVYTTLSNTLGWRKHLWKWNCPSKLFIWLLLEDKILTWKNLQRRGWSGPGLCYMCRTKEDSYKHLFVSCPFTVLIWESKIGPKTV
jgi:hypothetical protein